MTEPYDPAGAPTWHQGQWQQQQLQQGPQAAPYWGPQSTTGTVDPTNIVGRRVGAAIVDQIILLIPETAVIVALMWGPVFGAGGLVDQVESTSRSRAAGPAFDGAFMGRYLLSIAVVWTLMFLYYFITERVFHGSPGKLMFGLRVTGATGAVPITWGQSAIRNVLRVLFDASLIALIVILVSKGHRRVGDMAAHTLVIDKAWVGRFVEIYPPSGVPPWEPANSAQPYVAPPMPGAS
ncbi:MAG: RDD family protein [Acidimicrobiia bacterium]|nr:RDD family protein [Acidimicrobiia bacterium]